MENLRVAIVHDRLDGYGNEERVLVALHQIFPQAPIYLGWLHPKLQSRLQFKIRGKAVPGKPPGIGFPGSSLRSKLSPFDPEAYQSLKRLQQVPLYLSGAQGLPGIAQRPQRYRFLMPYYWEALDFSRYDLVISSSFLALSHSIRVQPTTLHLCYCHTPPRQIWESPSAGGIRGVLETHLRQYDFYAAQRVDRFLTPSERSAQRIYHFYRRSAEVMPPPVEIVGDGHAGERYYLYIGPLQRSLQLDVLIQTFNRLQRPLKLVGTGPDRAALQAMAGETITFLGAVADLDLDQVYANATAFVSPSWDLDFCLEAVQAMGRGVPVIAYQRSGLGEVVLHYRTGLLFEDPTATALENAILEFERLRFLSQACIDRAQDYTPTVFAGKLEWFIAQAWDEFCQRRSKPAFS